MDDAVKAEVLGGGLLAEVRSSPTEASAWERGLQLSGTQHGRLTFPPASGGRSLLGHPVECLQGSEMVFVREERLTWLHSTSARHQMGAG